MLSEARRGCNQGTRPFGLPRRQVLINARRVPEHDDNWTPNQDFWSDKRAAKMQKMHPIEIFEKDVVIPMEVDFDASKVLRKNRTRTKRMLDCVAQNGPLKKKPRTTKWTFRARKRVLT